MLVNVGKGIEIEVPFESFPANALSHVQYIGARNVLMDCHASVTADEYPDANEREAVARAMVEKKLAALMSGEVRVQSTRTADPFTVELNRLSMAELVKKLRRAGKKAANYEKATLRAAADKLVTDEMRALARKNIETAIPVDETVSLADLGL